MAEDAIGIASFVAAAVAEQSKRLAMRTYCTLVISTDSERDPRGTISSLFGIEPTHFVDNQDEERQQSLARLRKALPKLAGIEPLRYVWTRSSQGRVHSEDFAPHARWVLAEVSKFGHALCELEQLSCSAYMTCFWEGAGRGGGPTISPEIASLLVDQGIELRFDNYFVDE